MRQHGRHIYRAAGKKFFEQQAFFGRFRVKGKGRPADLDPELSFEPFYTPGTEIAPGSNIITEYFQCVGLVHGNSS